MKNTLSLFAVVLVLAACSKPKPVDPSGPTPPGGGGSGQITQKLQSLHYYKNLGVLDEDEYTDNFQYDASGNLSIVNMSRNVKATITYVSGKAAKIVYTNMMFPTYDTLSYNSAGQLTTIERYENNAPIKKTTYTYSGGHMVKMEQRVNDLSAVYTYDVSGYLTKVQRYYPGSTLLDTYEYTHGTVSNRFKGTNFSGGVTDASKDFDDDLQTIMYDLLMNNETLADVIKYSEGSNPLKTYNITYDTNANGYITRIKSNGGLWSEFQY
jgi:hypothetical protein